MSRQDAITTAERHLDCGAFREELARRIAIPTASRVSEQASDLKRYVEDVLVPAFHAMGFETAIYSHEHWRLVPFCWRPEWKILMRRPYSTMAMATS